jgi:hypothetical protein
MPRSNADAEEDCAAELTPQVRSVASWRVERVEVLSGFRLRVRFNDGTEGVVELEAFLNSGSAGVLAVLRDPHLFMQARVSLGVVTWPNDLDLAPDTMHREIKEHGTWTVR